MDAISLTIGLVIGILGGVIIGLILWRGKQVLSTPPPVIDLESIKNAVKTAATESVKTNREETVQLAKDQIGPIVTAATTKIDEAKTGIEGTVESLNNYLQSVGTALSTIEAARLTSYASLDERVKALVENEKNLRDSANQLSNAIRNPQAKGNWGETTLKRIAELSGMTEYCDFDSQVSITVDGRERRPDMVVNLPSNRVIIVDSKAPTSSYLSALEAKTPEETEKLMKDHAKKIKDYAVDLSKREYWKGFNAMYKESLELVVMYIPGESFLYAALQEDKELVNKAMEANIIIATPTILLSLMKAIARGWSERKVEENAKVILEAGKELYERLKKISEDISKLGDNIEKVAKGYNALIGSYEGRVLVSARKFGELGPGNGKQIESPAEIEVQVRELKGLGGENSTK
jgi:DNA recombination protein RmuC